MPLPGTASCWQRRWPTILNIEPGDTLTVEVREGRRPTLSVPVAGVARDAARLASLHESGRAEPRR